jgi:hypothetical protein
LSPPKFLLHQPVKISNRRCGDSQALSKNGN